jgi:hypothetical protein
MARLALERYIQTWVETISSSGKMPKFFRLSYAEQLKWVAMLNREAFPEVGSESVSTMIENADNGSIYKVADKFGEHLHKTHLTIPISVLPHERQTIYIQFPKGISFQGQGHTFDHAILDIGSPELLWPQIKSEPELISKMSNFTLYRICTIPSEAVDGTGHCPSLSFLVPKDPSVMTGRCLWATGNGEFVNTSSYFQFEPNMNIVDFIQQHPSKSIPTDIVDFCLKVLLYIHTGDPDLQPEAKRYPCATNPEKYIRHIENHCPFTVLNLGYGFHERHRHVDSTMVTGHFRWQPYGQKLSKVKLIWIEAHERSYKKAE